MLRNDLLNKLQIIAREQINLLQLNGGKTPKGNLHTNMALMVPVYTEVLRGNFGSAAALSVVLSIASMVSVLLFNKFSGKDGISL